MTGSSGNGQIQITLVLPDHLENVKKELRSWWWWYKSGVDVGHRQLINPFRKKGICISKIIGYFTKVPVGQFNSNWSSYF